MQCLEELLEGKISQLDLISKTKKNEKRFYHLYEGGNPQTPWASTHAEMSLHYTWRQQLLKLDLAFK